MLAGCVPASVGASLSASFWRPLKTDLREMWQSLFSIRFGRRR